MQTWSEQDLSAHLFAVAEARARQAHRKLEPGAENRLRGLIALGAEKLTSPLDPEQREKDIAEAVVGIVEFVGLMARAAESMPDYNRAILGEKTFDRAKAWFCPRRPFC